MRKLILLLALLVFPPLTGCLGPLGHHKSEEGWIGVMIAVPQGKRHVEIQEVLPKTPAERAGLKAGDVVKAWNEETIPASVDAVVSAIRASGHTRDSKIEILRDSQTLTLPIRP